MKKQKSNQNTAKETEFPVCRFSAEDCALLMSVGIDPMGDVPDEVLALIKMGVPVLSEEPDFLKEEMREEDPSPKGGKQ